MDARQAQLVRALAAQRQGGVARGASLGGGRALPFAQGVTSPLGLGGYWSTPISFNPAGNFAANASLGAGTAAAGAADSTGAGIGGVLPGDATPTPGGGATQAAPAVTPSGGGYQSGGGDPTTPWIPPSTPSPSPTPGPVLGSNPGGAPAPGGNAHYGGLNAGDPSDPFNYYYLYKNSFGY